ncbi:MAG: M15 family metallopeptidase [Erysipelotrichaceae bacterium]|nr:M15 family metallopeptidase [Erysipelotrichaceae bacterium]MCD8574497.1 M15 family metallopeptidase [Erysipelotrichaceae bacterium]
MTPLLLLLSLLTFNPIQPLTPPVDFSVQQLIENHQHLSRRQDRLQTILNQKNPFHSTYDPNITLTIPIENPTALDVVINRLHGLTHEHEPEDLVNLRTLDATQPSQRLREEAAQAFLKLKAAVLNDLNLTIEVRSGYRSFATQMRLFNQYALKDGVRLANTYSAFAGQSEHQSGLSMDVAEQGSSFLEFGSSLAYPYLQAHAYKYGFILRYPRNQSHITGYIYEPWHWRYVGVALATQLKEQGCTLDEWWIHSLK